MVVFYAPVIPLPSWCRYEVFKLVYCLLNIKILPSPCRVQSSFQPCIHRFLSFLWIGSFIVCDLQWNHIKITSQVSMCRSWNIFCLACSITPIPCVRTYCPKTITACATINTHWKLIHCRCEPGNWKRIRDSYPVTLNSTPVTVVVLYTKLNLKTANLIVSVGCRRACVVTCTVAPVPLIKSNCSVRIRWCW